MNWTFFAHFAKSWSFLSGLSKTSPYPHWTGTGLSHTGRVRSSNQDAFAVDNHLGLWVVADGMGGHAGGNIASDIAVSMITKEVRSALAGIFTHKYRAESQRADILREAVAAAGAEIQKRASRELQLSGMGTTVAAALYCSHPSTSVIIGHLGDSRAYLIDRTRFSAGNQSPKYLTYQGGSHGGGNHDRGFRVGSNGGIVGSRGESRHRD